MNFKIAFGIVIGLLFVCLIALFCGLLIKLYMHKIKTYTQLIYQKDIDYQKALNTTIIETQEQVLQNISQDLHDDAGQQLTYINFQLEHLKLDAPQMNEALAPISESVLLLSKSIRSISHSLNNQLLRQHDVIKAIGAEVERLQKNNAIQVEFICKELSKKIFTTNEQIVIYRIFQEIINNILKHAKATFIVVELKTTPDFEMIVSDNGVGFEIEKQKNNQISLGLNNMVERASLIKYTLHLKSKPNEGTTVILSEKTSA
jgi:signal transduction histidine kinase